MSIILLGIGLVLIIEGLVFALAPSRLEDALEAIRNISPETRRILGLGAICIGALLVAWGRSLGV